LTAISLHGWGTGLCNETHHPAGRAPIRQVFVLETVDG